MKSEQFKRKVYYEIFPKSFCDGNDDGVGDLLGIISKLDYLQWLGIDCIWITPFYPSEFKDNGYDVADYYNVDSSMGTMADFERLVAEARRHGIDVMIDMVFNHTSNKHIWFLKALAGDEKYQDYYIFKDGVKDCKPTNWKSKLGGSCWEYVPNLKKYYLHLFGTFQPDLNWRNPEVKTEIIKILWFWIKKGVKGFRFDVCNLFDKPEVFVDDLLGDGRSMYTDGLMINDYFKMMNEKAFGQVEDFVTIGEVSSTTIEKSVEYARLGNHELSMVFTFYHLKVDYKDNKKWTLMAPDMKLFRKIVSEWQTSFAKNDSWLGLFLNNHDQPRAVSRFGDVANYHYRSATGLALMMFLLKGSPYVYQGEEIGMTNYDFKSIDEFFDPETIGNGNDLLNEGIPSDQVFKILQQKCRDHARTVMQWSDGLHAGFSSVSEEVVWPVNPNFKTINVEAEKKDAQSILNFYRKLIALRKSDDIFIDGEIEFLEIERILIYRRKLLGRSVLVIANISDQVVVIDADLIEHKKTLLNNVDSLNPEIKPYQAVVLVE